MVRTVFGQDGCVQVRDVIPDEPWAVIEPPLLAKLRCALEAGPERGGSVREVVRRYERLECSIRN